MKVWLGCLGLILVAVGALAQGIPESKKEMGQDYRWVYSDTTAAGVTDTLRIRFPDSDSDTNAILPATGNIATTTTGKTTVWWLQLTKLDGLSQTIRWIVWSPVCIPEDSMSVFTNESVSFFTFGGCPVDSVWCMGGAAGTNIQVFAADGK